MDFPSSNDQPSKTGHKHQQLSSSELFSSAKLVADAAKSKLNNEQADEGKAAGAAANLLGAASQYEEKSYGKYVEQAEDYLHKYQSSHSTTTTTAAGHQSGGDTATTQSSGEDEKTSGSGGAGDYFKMAQGLFK